MLIKDILENKFIIFLLLMFVVSCGKKELNKKDYLNWINNPNNGLILKEEIGEAIYTLALRPHDFVFLNEDSVEINNNVNQVENNIRDVSFVLKMSPKDNILPFLAINNQSESEPYDRINYYLNEFIDDIKLVNGKDTLIPSNLIYERYYNISPSQSVVFGFENVNYNEDIRIVVNDRAISTGNINFNFKKGILKQIPKLIL